MGPCLCICKYLQSYFPHLCWGLRWMKLKAGLSFAHSSKKNWTFSIQRFDSEGFAWEDEVRSLVLVLAKLSDFNRRSIRGKR